MLDKYQVEFLFQDFCFCHKNASIKSKTNGQPQIEFYLGGYGNFDKIAKKICLKFKQINKNEKICFITPYKDENYLKKHRHIYDEIIFPDISKTPKKYAIYKRNLWIVKKKRILLLHISITLGKIQPNLFNMPEKSIKTI